MSKRQFILGIFLASIIGGLVAIGGYSIFNKEKVQQVSPNETTNAKFTNYRFDTTSYTVPEGLNFVAAADVATPAVVHIKSTVEATASERGYESPWDDMLRDFFGERPPQQRRPGAASGSGVIIASDGYIVTNNHVIENADEIEVTLNDNRRYEAELIGTDPNTDLAVIKINESNLQHLKYGNSDVVKIGEWVLAVGNPFNLTSTVTAGIVSAKARNIRILQRQYGIESFIQTDAAVNPGNSGGALVNLNGELIGINTAIATPTGTYAGYSFAVPVSLVKKVVKDLIEYGVVQRALLGVSIADVNDPRLEEDVDELNGVYVLDVAEESAAREAGLEKGDVITQINGKQVNNVAELQEMVARNRPGDEIEVTYKRDKKTRTTTATLKNMANTTNIVRRTGSLQISGSTFTNLTAEEKGKLDIEGGVKLTEIGEGKWKDAGVKEGFIITSVDKRPVVNTEEFLTLLNNSRGGILIGGMYEDGEEAYYGLSWK